MLCSGNGWHTTVCFVCASWIVKRTEVDGLSGDGLAGWAVDGCAAGYFDVAELVLAVRAGGVFGFAIDLVGGLVLASLAFAVDVIAECGSAGVDGEAE